MSPFTFDERDVLISPTCCDCKHADLFGNRKCSAFPDGIPLEIWCGDVSHNTVVDGDGGIVFEQMTDEDYAARRKACGDSMEETDAKFEHYFPGRLKEFDAKLEEAMNITTSM